VANAYIQNQRPTTYGGALSLLVEMLVSAGWKYKASGDGLSGYSATGKIFSGTGSGALGWSNNRAWARLEDPSASGGRELVFQHDNGGGARIKYSSAAKFIGGTPSATVTPTAADQVVLWGSGTEASPSNQTWFNGNIAVNHVGGGGGFATYLGAAMDTAPYGFWFYGSQTGSSNYSIGYNSGNVLMMDPVHSVPEDPDPVVFHIGYNTGLLSGFNFVGGPGSGNSTYGSNTVGGSNYGTFGYMDAAKTRFLAVLPSMYVTGQSGQTDPSNSGTMIIGYPNSSAGWLVPNPFSGKRDMLPFFYMRMQNGNTELPGIKGWSSLARLSCLPWTFRETTLNRTWIALGMLWLPWDGATTPLQ